MLLLCCYWKNDQLQGGNKKLHFVLDRITSLTVDYFPVTACHIVFYALLIFQSIKIKILNIIKLFNLYLITYTLECVWLLCIVTATIISFSPKGPSKMQNSKYAQRISCVAAV